MESLLVLDPVTTETKSLPADWSRELDRLDPISLADLLLAAVASRRIGAVALEPAGAQHLLRADLGGTSQVLGATEAGLADATCARLALIAGIEIGGTGQRLGRARVRVTTSVADVLVAVRTSGHGLAAAIHRIATTEDDATLDPATGSGAAGRYRLLEELGRGGMGVVYRAEHIALEKPVAIKVLHPGLARDANLAVQFELEARAACRARHPGIVDVTDFGRFSDGRAFIVMELVEGETLGQLLSRGPLVPSRAVTIARRIATALRAAADAGVVHRDLKPGNVFVLEGDRVKIGDFGVACIMDGTRASNDVVGTVGYMAPEQARGQPVDTRVDLYALGCVLFEMLAGRPPFQGASVSEVIEGHSTAPVPPIDNPHAPVPPELSRVVHRAMAKRPEERYQTPAEMLADLVAASRALAPVGWRRWQE
jgi:serine/threonine-protein kinase